MKRIIFCLALLNCFWWTACEDAFTTVVEIEIPEHIPALATTCEISNEMDKIEVLVATSQPIVTDEEINIIENATVTLLKNGTSIGNFVQNDSTKLYELDLMNNLADDGATYKLEVSAPNYEMVTAESAIPNKVELNDISYEPDATLDPYGYRVDALKFEVIDEKGVENFYAFDFFIVKNENGDTNIYNPYGETTDFQLERSDAGFLISDASFEDGKYVLNFSIDTWFDINEGDQVIVQVKNLSRESYLYNRSYEIYQNAQFNPFAEPVVVFNNIENGHGIFQGYSVNEYVIDF